MATTKLGEKFALVISEEVFRPISEYLKDNHDLVVTPDQLSEIVGAPQSNGVKLALPEFKTSKNSSSGSSSSSKRGKQSAQKENPGGDPDKYEWRFVPKDGEIPCEYVGKMKDYKGYKCGKSCKDGADGCAQHKGKTTKNDKSLEKSSKNDRVAIDYPVNIPNGIKPPSNLPDDLDLVERDDDGYNVEPVEFKVDGKNLEYQMETKNRFAINNQNKVEGIFNGDQTEIRSLSKKEEGIVQDMGLDLA